MTAQTATDPLELARTLINDAGGFGLGTGQACASAAQAVATIALVEAQREANEIARTAAIIALGQVRMHPSDFPVYRHLIAEPRGEHDVAVPEQIAKALGL